MHFKPAAKQYLNFKKKGRKNEKIVFKKAYIFKSSLKKEVPGLSQTVKYLSSELIEEKQGNNIPDSNLSILD